MDPPLASCTSSGKSHIILCMHAHTAHFRANCLMNRLAGTSSIDRPLNLQSHLQLTSSAQKLHPKHGQLMNGAHTAEAKPFCLTACCSQKALLHPNTAIACMEAAKKDAETLTSESLNVSHPIHPLHMGHAGSLISIHLLGRPRACEHAACENGEDDMRCRRASCNVAAL